MEHVKRRPELIELSHSKGHIEKVVCVYAQNCIFTVTNNIFVRESTFFWLLFFFVVVVIGACEHVAR